MDFTPANTLAGMARDLKISRPTLYNKLKAFDLTTNDVLNNDYLALRVYASTDPKYLLILEDMLKKVHAPVATQPTTPGERLNRATITRFSKQSGISLSAIDRELLAMIMGSYKDLVAAYKDLQRVKYLKSACDASGVTWEQLTNFAKRKS